MGVVIVVMEVEKVAMIEEGEEMMVRIKIHDGGSSGLKGTGHDGENKVGPLVVLLVIEEMKEAKKSIGKKRVIRDWEHIDCQGI